jgi:uncharacterized protein with PIN domain
MFETIKSIIGDIASGAVKDQRIALSHEQLSALDLKLHDALARIRELEAELERCKRVDRKGDECPYCNERSGKLTEIKPHPQSLLNQTGTKIGLYKCTECGKTYEKQISMRNKA